MDTRVHLASPGAIQKRVARGKKVLASSPRLFELSAHDFAPRLRAVLRALYVLFSEGYRLRRQFGRLRAGRRIDPAATVALFAPNGDVIVGRNDGSLARYCRQ